MIFSVLPLQSLTGSSTSSVTHPRMDQVHECEFAEQCCELIAPGLLGSARKRRATEHRRDCCCGHPHAHFFNGYNRTEDAHASTSRHVLKSKNRMYIVHSRASSLTPKVTRTIRKTRNHLEIETTICVAHSATKRKSTSRSLVHLPM